jgi:hypothetical protein
LRHRSRLRPAGASRPAQRRARARARTSTISAAPARRACRAACRGVGVLDRNLGLAIMGPVSSPRPSA